MDKKTEIEEFDFHQYKSQISVNNIDINKIVASDKLPFAKRDFKYFIGYKDSEKIDPYKYTSQKIEYNHIFYNKRKKSF